jgi:hypothetical protein
MNRSRLTLRRGVPIVAVLAVAAAACGDSDDGADSSSALATAAATTVDVNSMSFDLAFTIEGPDVHQQGSVGGTAEFTTNRGDVVTTSDGPPESRAIFDGDEFWLAVGGTVSSSALPDGKEWVHGNLSDVGESTVIFPLEPPAILFLLDGARNVRADADGDSTRYAFDVDMSDAAERAPADRREEV